jgi:hypothetical protein
LASPPHPDSTSAPAHAAATDLVAPFAYTDNHPLDDTPPE